MAVTDLLDSARHHLGDADTIRQHRRRLEIDGVVVLDRLLTPKCLQLVLDEVDGREDDAFYADSSHNVYLTDGDPDLPADHVVNRQVVSSKGLLADDQLAETSALRTIYRDPTLRAHLAGLLDVESLHPYADDVSSINVHFHRDGEQLGWHYDNSSFAVTTLIQAPETGGTFEYVPEIRSSGRGHGDAAEHARVKDVLDQEIGVEQLGISPGDLVIFRGRDSLHRVTPSRGDTTRVLVVFAFNAESGVALSASARSTFYGR